MAYHPFSESESKAPAELAVCIVFLILTYLSVGARCYVRIYIIKSFGWDDALMVVALVFFNVWAISIIIIAYEYGGGTRVDVIGTAMDWIIVSETFYVITAMMVKLSLGIFFLRIVIKPWQRVMVYIVMILIALTSIFFFFFLIFLCGNPKDYLVRYVFDQCAPRNVQVALAYLSAALGAAADWIYALIPIQIVMQANMDLRSKFSVLFILSLGTAGCVCSTVRLKYIEGLVSPTDFFWNAATIAIWSGIECGAGITAGSLATLRPLFKRWFATVRSLASGSLNSSGRRNRKNKEHPNASDSSAGAAGRHAAAGNGPLSNARSFTPKSLPSKSSSGKASSGAGAERPLTAWPSPSGCWEKLDNDDGGGGGGVSVEERECPADNASSLELAEEPPSSSLDLIIRSDNMRQNGATAASGEDMEMYDISRETSLIIIGHNDDDDDDHHHHHHHHREDCISSHEHVPRPPPSLLPASASRTAVIADSRPLSIIAERDSGSGSGSGGRWEWPAALDDGDEDDDGPGADASPSTTTGRWEWPVSSAVADGGSRLRMEDERRRRRQRRWRTSALPPTQGREGEEEVGYGGDALVGLQRRQYGSGAVDVEVGRPFTVDAEGRMLDVVEPGDLRR